jgi:hypothetical protein
MLSESTPTHGGRWCWFPSGQEFTLRRVSLRVRLPHGLMRRLTRTAVGAWTIPVDSVGGYGNEQLADEISDAVARAPNLDDAVVGYDARTGVISVYVDVADENYSLALARGRKEVVDVLSAAGIRFALDPDQSL